MLKVVFTVCVLIASIVPQVQSAGRCARAASSCLLAPQATEGPYYWNSTVRQDITEGKGGLPFHLKIHVLDTTTCSPLSNVIVDLWHCDAQGIYSHYIAASLGQSNAKTDNSTFFRGQQLTNDNGVAEFDTIYPGWYRGRATHMHVKVHVGASLTNIDGALFTKGGHTSYTGQLFFDDLITDEVGKSAPYTLQTVRRTRNNEDGIFAQARGTTTMIPIQYLTGDGVRGAMSGEITLGVDPSSVSTSESGPNGGGPNGGGPNGVRPTKQPPISPFNLGR